MLTVEQSQALFAAFAGTEIEPLIEFLATSGARRGEGCAFATPT